MIRLALLLALGVTKGGSIFIRKNAPLRASTATNAKTLKQLEKGTKVVWLGPDARVKTMHNVRTEDGVEGFVLQQELSPSDPNVPASDSSNDLKSLFSDGGVEDPHGGCWRPHPQGR